MKMKLMFAIPAMAVGMAGLAFAAAHFTLTDVATLAGQKLKVGEYAVSVKNDKAEFTSPDGKTFQVPVKVEQAPAKFSQTSTITRPGNGNPDLIEVDLGGSMTRLIFGQ
jgi:hypothetical protein